MRRMQGVLTAILLLVLAFGTVHAQVANDTIVVGIHADIQNLDPHNFRHRETETVLRNIYDGLVTRGPDMQPVPELAESIRQLDERTWEFVLRPGREVSRRHGNDRGRRGVFDKPLCAGRRHGGHDVAPQRFARTGYPCGSGRHVHGPHPHECSRGRCFCPTWCTT